MPYDEALTNRVREALSDENVTQEIEMFQGLCFMVNDKLSICIRNQTLLCRIGKEQAAIELDKDHCQQMMSGDRPMKDYVWVDGEQLKTHPKLNHWIKLALEFNKVAKASKKRRKGKGER
jgi:TfoX/Sxy family transcriptional regulator of competence genes